MVSGKPLPVAKDEHYQVCVALRIWENIYTTYDRDESWEARLPHVCCPNIVSRVSRLSIWDEAHLP